MFCNKFQTYFLYTKTIDRIHRFMIDISKVYGLTHTLISVFIYDYVSIFVETSSAYIELLSWFFTHFSMVKYLLQFIFSYVRECEQHDGVLKLLVAPKWSSPLVLIPLSYLNKIRVQVQKYNDIISPPLLCASAWCASPARQKIPLMHCRPPWASFCLLVVPKGKEGELHTHHRYDSPLIVIEGLWSINPA